MRNIEIERKYHIPYDITLNEAVLFDNCKEYFGSLSHDRYYEVPGGLIRIRDDSHRGFPEMTAKTYFKDNLVRTEVNLRTPNSNIQDYLEFVKIAKWEMKIEFKQYIKVWRMPDAVISQTIIHHIKKGAYKYDKKRQRIFSSKSDLYDEASFVEIEAENVDTEKEAIRVIEYYANQLGLDEFIPWSLIQLLGVYPKE
jgi:adenylate cyclase class IV